MKQPSTEKARIRRLREKYQRRLLIVGIVLFIVGFLLGGFVGNRIGRRGADRVVANAVPVGPTPIVLQNGEDEAVAFEESGEDEEGFEEAEPVVTPEPTPEPTMTPEPQPTTLAIVPFGESYTYTTQVKADGTARMAADDEPFETVSFTQTMKGYMLPGDFKDKYGSSFRLKGTEAGAEFELTLNDYTGSVSMVPQQIIQFSFQSENGESTELGYQLMDAWVSGDYGVSLTTNAPKLFYKRYEYSNTGAPMKYLAVNTYTDGIQNTILFELEGDAPVVTDAPREYKELKKGDKGDEVVDLQKRLIELGRLEGEADGDFGSKTETAIKALQEIYGMEATGVATNEFQQQLFADEEIEDADEIEVEEPDESDEEVDEEADIEVLDEEDEDIEEDEEV